MLIRNHEKLLGFPLITLRTKAALSRLQKLDHKRLIKWLTQLQIVKHFLCQNIRKEDFLKASWSFIFKSYWPRPLNAATGSQLHWTIPTGMQKYAIWFPMKQFCKRMKYRKQCSALTFCFRNGLPTVLRKLCWWSSTEYKADYQHWILWAVCRGYSLCVGNVWFQSLDPIPVVPLVETKQGITSCRMTNNKTHYKSPLI